MNRWQCWNTSSGSRMVAVAVVVAGVSACTHPATSGGLPVIHREAIPDTAVAVKGPAITGSVRDSQGHVVSGATIYASVELSGREQFGRGLKAFVSLGLLCADKEGCSAPNAAGVAALDGTFAIPVPKGGDPANSLRVTVVVERGSTRVATSILLPSTARAGIQVGNVPVASSGPRTYLAGGLRHYSPPSVPAAHPDSATIQMSRVSGASVDGQPITEAPSSDVSGGFDQRLIEDGRVLLESTQKGTIGGYPALLSSSLVLTGTAVPPSRGAACSLTDHAGKPIPQKPCGLTDGVLDTRWTPHDDPTCARGPCPGTIQNDHRDTYVTFTTPLAARLLVIRGCGFTCHVSITDTNGTHALHEPTSGAGPADVYSQVLGGAALRSVHIVTSTGGFLDSLREVSVFT